MERNQCFEKLRKGIIESEFEARHPAQVRLIRKVSRERVHILLRYSEMTTSSFLLNRMVYKWKYGSKYSVEKHSLSYCPCVSKQAPKCFFGWGNGREYGEGMGISLFLVQPSSEGVSVLFLFFQATRRMMSRLTLSRLLNVYIAVLIYVRFWIPHGFLPTHSIFLANTSKIGVSGKITPKSGRPSRLGINIENIVHSLVLALFECVRALLLQMTATLPSQRPSAKDLISDRDLVPYLTFHNGKCLSCGRNVRLDSHFFYARSLPKPLRDEKFSNVIILKRGWGRWATRSM